MQYSINYDAERVAKKVPSARWTSHRCHKPGAAPACCGLFRWRIRWLFRSKPVSVRVGSTPIPSRFRPHFWLCCRRWMSSRGSQRARHPCAWAHCRA